MNPSYDYILPTGTRLFRATTISKEGKWYNLSLEDSYVYGENITEYSTTKDLKLLNIASLTFHSDFIDRLNILYPDSKDTGIFIDKIKCLIPLGLIDLNSQNMGANFLSTKLPIDESNWGSLMEYSNKLLMNRHRLSDHTHDAHLITILEKIYGNVYNGYISPFQWPTKVHGGYFPRELCLFKIQNINEEKTHKRPQIGGSQKLNYAQFVPFNLNIDEERFKKNMEKECELIKDYPIKLFWNPHTEDTYVKPTKIVNKRNITRKRRNNAN